MGARPKRWQGLSTGKVYASPETFDRLLYVGDQASLEDYEATTARQGPPPYTLVPGRDPAHRLGKLEHIEIR